MSKAHTKSVRSILHSDLNNFYASVELMRHPEWIGRPLVVCGDKEARHGVVLAKNYEAKHLGVKTGDVIWEAEKKCGKNLVAVNADFSEYLRVSKEVRKIYERYTDMVEAFGIDECWLDVTQSGIFGDAEQIAFEIKESIKKEIGITASVGVSWNKIFSKLGSDMKKPDAVTVITPENFRDTVWKLPVEDLLYVGVKTKQKLNLLNVFTIGDLANAPLDMIKGKLHKWGEYLHIFANGLDTTPVAKIGELQNVKSIGNSLTNYKDMTNDDEVKTLIYLLSDSVSARMREGGFSKARTVHLHVRDSNLMGNGFRGKLRYPSRLTKDIADFAFMLFKQNYTWDYPVRGLGVSVSDFVSGDEQLDIFGDYERYEKNDRLEKTVDKIRRKYGHEIIQLATIKKDEKLSHLDIKGDHTIHPKSFFGN